MAGPLLADPWSQFRQPAPAADADPWASFRQAPATQPFVTPAAPPGEIIHTGSGADISTTDPTMQIERTPTPDDATPDQVNAIDRGNMINAQALKARAAMDAAAGPFMAQQRRVAGVLDQGSSLGAGDEALSVLTAATPGIIQGPGDFTDRYDLMQAIQRQDLEQQRKAHPLASAATELGGGGAAAGALAQQGLTLGGRTLAEGQPLLNGLLRGLGGAVEGGAYGAVTGFNAGDGLEDRIDRAKANIPLGAAVGAGAVPLGDLLGAAGSTIMNYIGAKTNPVAQAQKLLAQKLGYDSMSPADVAQRVADAATQGKPDFAMVDAAGRNTLKTAKAAAQSPGEFRQTAGDFLDTRQFGQAGRIGGDINQALGQNGSDAFDTVQNIIANRKADAGPLYTAAYADPTPQGDQWSNFMTKPSVQAALPKARAVANEDQVPLSSLFEDVPNPDPSRYNRVLQPTIQAPTIQGWDYIKRALDTRVSNLFSPGADGADAMMGQAVKQTRDQLRSALGEASPNYQAALNRYADDASSLDAVQTGRNLATAKNPDEARATFQSLNPGDQDMARLGASRELQVPLQNQPPGVDVSRGLTTPNAVGKIQTLATDPAAAQAFADRLALEQRMATSRRQIMGGSDTAEKLGEFAGSRPGSILAAALQGRFPTALGLLGNAVVRGANGMTPEVAQEMGDYLLSRNPEMIRSLQPIYDKLQQQGLSPSIIPAIINGAFNGSRNQAKVPGGQ